jgi:hypothetical protein
MKKQPFEMGEVGMALRRDQGHSATAGPAGDPRLFCEMKRFGYFKHCNDP